jgi:hypothetical protein
MAEYQIIVRDQGWRQVAVIDNFTSLSFQHKLNDVGSFTIVMPDTFAVEYGISDLQDKISLFQLDGQVEIWRADSLTEMPKYKEFVGLFRKMTPSIDSDGKRIATIEGFCPNHLLTRRVIAYNAGTVLADKDDAADIVMWEYVDENCGQSATPDNGRVCDPDYGAVVGDEVDANGVMPGFTAVYPTPYLVSPDGVVAWQGSKPFENLMDVIQDIAAYANIDFRVITDGIAYDGNPAYIFNVYNMWLGVDRTDMSWIYGVPKLLFSIENSTLSDASYEFDRSKEATVVFVLGAGDMSTRSVLPVEASNRMIASPLNRIEVARSASEQDYVYQLRSYGISSLEELRYTDEISATILQQKGLAYSKNYSLGDHVLVVFRGVTKNYRITGVNISCESSGAEKIELILTARKSTLPGIQSDL